MDHNGDGDLYDDAAIWFTGAGAAMFLGGAAASATGVGAAAGGPAMLAGGIPGAIGGLFFVADHYLG